jgi:hypothetical protein
VSEPDPKFVALYEGVVVDNKDPLRMGRVRFQVPGLIEPASDWAMPVGSTGGGSDGVGFYWPPQIGAEVAVFFVMGDVDQPRYLIGAWGAPAGKTEVPRFARALTLEEAGQVHGFASKRFEVVLDDRPGHEAIRITDLDHPEDLIEIDGVSHGVTIAGSVAVVIRSVGVVDIQALQIRLNGRIVRESTDPI